MEQLLLASELPDIRIIDFYITTKLTLQHLLWLDSKQYLRITNAHCYRTLKLRDNCSCKMSLIEADNIDGYIMKCGKKGDYKQSIRKDSFFFSSKLTIPTIIYVINSQQAGIEMAALSRLINISSEALNYILRKLQHKMYLLQQEPVFKSGDIIEIDEMWFKWRIEPNTGGYLDTIKQKSGKWIIGMINRDRTAIWIQPIPSRSEGRLSTVIQRYIVPGHTLMTDGLPSYNNLGDWYTHYVINKVKEGFARDPTEIDNCTRSQKKRLRVHVNKIENSWHLLRDLIRLRNAQCNRHLIHLTIAEYHYNFYKKDWFDLIKIE
jgi:hypothetical protein